MLPTEFSCQWSIFWIVKGKRIDQKWFLFLGYNKQSLTEALLSRLDDKMKFYYAYDDCIQLSELILFQTIHMSVHDYLPQKKNNSTRFSRASLTLFDLNGMWKKIGRESVFTEFQILIIFYLKKDTQGSSSEPLSPTWVYVMIAQHTHASKIEWMACHWSIYKNRNLSPFFSFSIQSTVTKRIGFDLICNKTSNFRCVEKPHLISSCRSIDSLAWVSNSIFRIRTSKIRVIAFSVTILNDNSFYYAADMLFFFVFFLSGHFFDEPVFV